MNGILITRRAYRAGILPFRAQSMQFPLQCTASSFSLHRANQSEVPATANYRHHYADVVSPYATFMIGC